MLWVASERSWYLSSGLTLIASVKYIAVKIIIGSAKAIATRALPIYLSGCCRSHITRHYFNGKKKRFALIEMLVCATFVA